MEAAFAEAGCTVPSASDGAPLQPSMQVSTINAITAVEALNTPGTLNRDEPDYRRGGGGRRQRPRCFGSL